MANPDLRPVADNPAVVGRERSAVVEGLAPKEPGDKAKTTATVGDQQYKTEFVKVYQDAGVIGVAMLTLLVLCIIMGWFSMRVLRMYTTMLDGRDAAEKTRLEFFEKLTTAVTTLSSDVKEVKNDLRSDHHTQNRDIGAITTEVRSLGDRLNQYLFDRREGAK